MSSPTVATSPQITKAKSSKILKVQNTPEHSGVNINNARRFYASNEVEVPIEQIYKKNTTVRSLNLTEAHFEVIPFIPISTANLGCFESMTVHEYCISLNCNVQNLLIFLAGQLAFETMNRRYRVHGGSNIMLFNYNPQKDILKQLNNASRQVCEGTPTTGVRNHLSRYGVALIHSFAQQFILKNIGKFIFTIYYPSTVPTEARVQPSWTELVTGAKLASPGIIKSFDPKTTIREAMKELNLDDKTQASVKASYFMNYHFRDLDKLFNLVASNLKDPLPLTEQIPEQGIETKMMSFTPFLQVIMKYPNVVSFTDNISLWSNLTKDKWEQKILDIQQVTDKFFDQKHCRSSSSQGTFLTRFALQTIRKQFDVTIDGYIALGPIFFMERCQPTTTWSELYARGFKPYLVYDEEYAVPMEFYKNMMEGGLLLYSGLDLRNVRVCPALSPSPQTLYARITNVTKTAAKLEEHHVISEIKKDQKKMFSLVTEMNNRMKTTISVNKYLKMKVPAIYAEGLRICMGAPPTQVITTPQATGVVAQDIEQSTAKPTLEVQDGGIATSQASIPSTVIGQEVMKKALDDQNSCLHAEPLIEPSAVEYCEPPVPGEEDVNNLYPADFVDTDDEYQPSVHEDDKDHSYFTPDSPVHQDPHTNDDSRDTASV